MSQIRQNLFSENKKPRFWDIKSPENYFVACPKSGKTFKLKIRIAQKWTYTFLYLFCWSLTDVPFLAKHFLIKKESTKNGHQMH